MNEQARSSLPARLAAGSEQAFAETYDEYADRLFAVAVAITGSPADAEDAVQELFAALYRGRGCLAEVENLRGYLFTSLRRTALRIVRSRRETQQLQVADEPSHCSPERQVDQRDELQQALAQISSTQREVIALKIEGGLTFAEIADVLQMSPNTAASRYRLALEKLRAILKKCQA